MTPERGSGQISGTVEPSSVPSPEPEHAHSGASDAPFAFDARSYNAGLVFGAVASVMVLGVVKDVWALLKPSGEGLLVFGFLMIRYSSLYRVWFGYAFTGDAAWYATVPHVLLYGAGLYGLITRRRWAWMLLSVYLLYILVSEALYAFFGGFGYLDRPVIPAEILWAHIPYYVVLVVLVGLVERSLWKCRSIFIN